MDPETALHEVERLHNELIRLRGSTKRTYAELKTAARDAHQKAQVPQAELARVLGLHRNTIAMWCTK